MDYDMIMPFVTSYTTEEPTMCLRFKHGRLQQMFIVRDYENRIPGRAAEEWRDVPDATPQGPPDA
jgi:hypothetical protein